MSQSKKPVWKIKDRAGKYLDTKGWSADREGSSCICYAPLYKNGKVVALIVASGDYDGTKDNMAINAAEILAALKAAPQGEGA
jgi:hypothetical protein